MEIVKDQKRVLGHIYRYYRLCRSTKSLLSGTFFENCKINIGDVILFIYQWAHENCSFKLIKHEISISRHPFVAWPKYLRDICTQKLMCDEQIIGGSEKV